MVATAAWPAAIRGGIGRLLAGYGTDLAVEYTYLCQIRRGSIEQCVDHTGAEVAVPFAFLPLIERLQERGVLLMIDDLQTDSVMVETSSRELQGAFLGVSAFDDAGSLLGVLLAHGLTARSWSNRELERAGDMALGVASLLIVDELRHHAERRVKAASQAREIRRQMYTISARSAEAASLPELSRILVRETPNLLNAEWTVVGVRHAKMEWQVYVAPEHQADFDAVFAGTGAPGEALLNYGAHLSDGRAEITVATVPEWEAIRDQLTIGSCERLVAATLSSSERLSMVLLCGFSSTDLDMRTDHLVDELLEDVRRVVARTASAQGQIQAALALQRSLLPPRIPQLDGFEIGRLYNSAADNSRVGGDWYDIVQIDSVTTGFVVGDVAGHDIRSAALMGQLRHVLASQLRDRRRPSGALAATDRYFADLDENVMATAVVIVIDQSTKSAHIALAGHPPPVLLSGDQAVVLGPKPGPPIGFGYGGYLEISHTLQTNDTLIAYTDGVIENRTGSLSELLDDFVDALRGAAGSVPELVNFLDRRSQLGELVDDVAALVVRIVD